MKDEQARSFFFVYPNSLTITWGMFFVDFNSLTVLGNAFSPFLPDSFAIFGNGFIEKAHPALAGWALLFYFLGTIPSRFMSGSTEGSPLRKRW